MSEIVKAEKGIPFPHRQYKNAKYPWDTMEVGDSFPVTGKSNGWMLAKSASHSRPTKKFKAGKMLDGTYRVWRIA